MPQKSNTLDKYLTRESLDRAMKGIVENAEWGLRHPQIYAFHPKDLEILRKLGLYKEFFKKSGK